METVEKWGGENHSDVTIQVTAPTNSWSGGALDLNCSKQCTTHQISISTAVTASATLVLLLNLILIGALISWKYGHTCKMFWFLRHLATADALIAFGFVFHHSRALYSCPQRQECGRTFFHESVFLMIILLGSYLSSHLFMLAITMDRFIAVVIPLRYTQFTRTRVVRLVAAIMWIVSLGFISIASIPLLMTEGRRRADIYKIITMATSVSSLLIAFIVIVLNIWIVKCAWSTIFHTSSSRAASSRPPPIPTVTSSTPPAGASQSTMTSPQQQQARNSMTPSTTTTPPSGSGHHGNHQISKKLVATLSLFVISFIVTSAPWSMTLFFCEPRGRCVIKREDDYTQVLLLLHALLIPVVYGIRVAQVKERVLVFWKTKFLIRRGNDVIQRSSVPAASNPNHQHRPSA